MWLSLERFSFLNFAFAFLALKLTGFFFLYIISIYTDINPFFYSDNSHFYNGNFSIFDANYGYSLYVKYVLSDGLHQLSLISIFVSTFGYLLLIFSIYHFKIACNNKYFLVYVILLAVHPYLTFHDFKAQPNVLLGYFLAFLFVIYHVRNSNVIFLSILVSLFFTIWKPNFGLMFFGFFAGIVFLEKRYLYFIPMVLVGLLTAFYSIEYSTRLYNAMYAYDNVTIGFDFNYALQVVRNIFFSLFAREKYLTLGFSVSTLSEFLIFLSLVSLLILHLISILRFILLLPHHKLFLILLLSIGPLIVSWLSISHMRYLIPYIPILLLGWIYSLKLQD